MKLSILTATYNRANFLEKLYDSIIQNLINDLEIEWLVMDDGSKDNTAEIMQKLIEQEKNRSVTQNDKESTKNIEIKYVYQENQGKMSAINNSMELVSGDLIIDCDSDDYFVPNAFKIIKEEFDKTPKDGLYAICFLSCKEDKQIDGTNFNNPISTMFDLYFKEGVTGEKRLVFYADIRKQYKHELEKGEKFITEARMYHKMDEKYKIKCVNQAISSMAYQNDGYTSNILKIFKANPFGYLKYFEEILQKDFKGVLWNKRLYAIKHYILFLTITHQKLNLKKVKNVFNKLLLILLFIPGKMKSKSFIKQVQ